MEKAYGPDTIPGRITVYTLGNGAVVLDGVTHEVREEFPLDASPGDTFFIPLVKAAYSGTPELRQDEYWMQANWAVFAVDDNGRCTRVTGADIDIETTSEFTLSALEEAAAPRLVCVIVMHHEAPDARLGSSRTTCGTHRGWGVVARYRRLGRIVPVGPAAALLLVSILLVVGGCGGSDKALDDTTTPTTPLTVAEVAPELAVFGDLAAIEAPPVTADFDSAGGELDLADGAMVTVPAGAFTEDTSLTVTVVGLALEYFDPRVGPAHTYVIQTDRDVLALDRPVVLEIPFPSEAGGVAILNEGEWVALPVAPGDTTKVEISHFSSVLVTHVPMAIEWLAQWGWVISQTTGRIIPGLPLTDAARMLAQEEAHQQWVMTEADQATRDFYGLDENGTYRTPTHTQEEMCDELQTVIAGYSDFSLPDDFDFSPYRLIRHLFDASDPKPQNDQMRAEAWSEFWDYTSASVPVIDRQVLARATPLTPGEVLKIAIDANGGNVPAGLLAAHNYLKHLSYFGRFYADPTYREEGLQQPVTPETGASVAKLEPWRQEDPANPAGRLDKMGPLYHIFAGAVVKAWFPNPNPAAVESFGDMAIGAEALLRTAAGWLGKDTPDREKGRADECGARLGESVVALARGEKPPARPEQPPSGSAEEAPSPHDGVYRGIYPGRAVDQSGKIVESVDGELEFTVDAEGNVTGEYAYALKNAETVATFTGKVIADGSLSASGTATTTVSSGKQVAGEIQISGQISGETFKGVSKSVKTGFEAEITATLQ